MSAANEVAMLVCDGKPPPQLIVACEYLIRETRLAQRYAIESPTRKEVRDLLATLERLSKPSIQSL
jgi:hypothetical protein